MNPLQNVLAGKTLTTPDAEHLMNSVLLGEVSPERLAGLLVALRFRGESREELSGFVRSLRNHAVKLPFQGVGLIDTCGTGGDMASTFNISTASALVLAACGVPVAKHGNRSASSKCGSADVLEALGISITLDPNAAAAQLRESNFCFLFAPHYHASLGKIRPVRTALGIPTVFNLLGPLINPAKVDRQLIGVSNPALLSTFAEILRDEGTTEALIVHGLGLDEITLSGETKIAHLKNGAITLGTLSPEDFDLPRAAHSELLGGDASENALVIERMFRNEQTGPKLNAVLANTSAALVVAGKAESFKAGVEMARSTIMTGKAFATLNQLRSQK